MSPSSARRRSSSKVLAVTAMMGVFRPRSLCVLDGGAHGVPSWKVLRTSEQSDCMIAIGGFSQDLRERAGCQISGGWQASNLTRTWRGVTALAREASEMAEIATVRSLLRECDGGVLLWRKIP